MGDMSGMVFIGPSEFMPKPGSIERRSILAPGKPPVLPGTALMAILLVSLETLFTCKLTALDGRVDGAWTGGVRYRMS